MAGPQLSQSSGHNRWKQWKQWWRRSSSTCCSKRILLLLVWQVLFTFSWSVLVYTVPTYMINGIVFHTLIFLSYSFAPWIGWLADVRSGRYEVFKFGSIASFLASILYYFAMFAGESASTLSTVLYSIAFSKFPDVLTRATKSDKQRPRYCTQIYQRTTVLSSSEVAPII